MGDFGHGVWEINFKISRGMGRESIQLRLRKVSAIMLHGWQTEASVRLRAKDKKKDLDIQQQRVHGLPDTFGRC